MDHHIAQLEQQLNSYDPSARLSALLGLANLLARGQAHVSADRGLANMHCHTFYSYNAYGHSPTALAWLGRKRGLAAIGVVDFDVLDGVDEFLSACEILGVRGSAGIETRVAVPQFATQVVNSPGEPGVAYHMGIGFATGTPPASAAPILASLRDRAAERNRAMLSRIAAHLDPVAVDYERDVLPLTPAGNATERHILAAIIRAAQRHFPRRDRRAAFWSDRLGVEKEQVLTAMAEPAGFADLMRSRLMKNGGVGHVPPTPDSFPSFEEFHSLVVGCGALPCVAWLDGTSEGEENGTELLEYWVGKGAVALNLIPERNWNLPLGPDRNLKIRKLREIVQAAAELDLPLNIGTEMNSPGAPLADDFSAPILAPMTRAFMAGAYFVYGHTVMQRGLALGYQSRWAQEHLPSRRRRNDFYETIGRRVRPGAGGMDRLRRLPELSTPAAILAALS